MNKKLLFIFALAFVLRLISLNQSLWLDEATTAKVVHEYGFTQIISEFSPSDFHPPLYYLLMKLWTNFFGYSEIALRMPSIIFSLLGGFVVYKIGEILKDKKNGIWAAIFFLFNPLIIYYSQEARMYMMATFLLAGSIYFLIKMLQNQKSNIKDQKYNSNLKNILFFNIFCILSFYTFYGSVFLIATFLLYFLYKKQYDLFFISSIINLISLIIISPLLLQQFIHARESLQIVTNWKQVLGTVSIKNLLLIPLKFSVGRISFEPKWLYYLVAGGWTMFVFSSIKTVFNKDSLLWIYLFIFPLIIGLLLSFFTPLLQYFRFVYLIPIMSILLTVVEKPRGSATAYRYVVVMGFLIFSSAYLLLPQFHREDWRSLALSLRNTRAVYMITSSSDPLKYYSSQLVIKELRTLEAIELEKQAIVVPYTADIYGFDYKKELMKRGFTYKETKTFRGLWYEVWVKNKDYVHTGSFLYSFITAKT